MFTLGYKSLLRDRLRVALATTGVALGVAAFLAVTLVRLTATTSLERDIAAAFGEIDVSARAETGADPDLSRFLALTDVRAAAMQVRVDTDAITGPTGRTEGVPLLGVPPAGAERLWRGFTLEEGELFGDGEQEVVLTPEMAGRLDVGVDKSLELRIEERLTPMRVSGRLASAGIARIRGGDVLFTSPSTVMSVAPAHRVEQTVFLDLSAGVDSGEWIEAHAGELPGYGLVDVRALGRGLRDQLQPAFDALELVGITALLAGAVMVLQTYRVRAQTNTRTYAVLVANGMSRPQLLRLISSEALWIGVVASVVGVVLGLALAAAGAAIAPEAVGAGASGLHVAPWVIIGALVLGLAASFAGAAIPAARLSMMSPAAAIRGHSPRPKGGLRAVFPLAGLALVAAGVAASMVITATASPAVRVTIIGATILGAGLVAPAVVRSVVAVAIRIVPWIRGSMSAVVVVNRLRDSQRSASAVGVLVVVFAMVLSVAAVGASAESLLQASVDRFFGADLRVLSAEPLAEDVRSTIESSPDVAAAAPIWIRQRGVKPPDRPGHVIPVLVVDSRSFLEVQSLDVDGLEQTAVARSLRAGEVLIKPTLVESYGLGPGESVLIESRSGPRPFPVAGVFRAESSAPHLIMGKEAATRAFDLPEPNGYIARVREGGTSALVDQLRDQSANPSALIIETPGSEEEDITGIIDNYRTFATPIIGAAAIVAVLALANTLTLGSLYRRRELSVLKAIGAHDRQLASSVIAEGLLMALIGLLLALPVTWVVIDVVIAVARQASNLPLTPSLPTRAASLLFVASAVGAVVAAALPARQAGRTGGDGLKAE